MPIVEVTDPHWLEFVGRQPEAMPFHHPDWATMVADCYGFWAFAVVTRDAAGQIQAGLPMVEVHHLGGGRRWVALPFTDYCPPVVSAPEDKARLVAALKQESVAAGVRRVEIRAPLAGSSVSGPAAFRHVLALGRDPAEVHARFHHSQVQRNIRRAEREDLTIRQGTCQLDLVDTFYQLHLRTRHRQGVPVQPRRFFRLLWEKVISTGLGSVAIVEAAGRPIAAAVFLAWNETAVYKFAASDERAWSLRPNHLLMWHGIRAACEQGCRWLDFGRTNADNQGLRAFKRSWGAVEEPLVYETLGARPQPAAAGNGMAEQLLASVIRHTPPVFCRAVGEALYRFAA